MINSHEQFMRYSRHLLMDDIGEAGQQKLFNARVLIVGLGGLGCPVALYLAAAGIGQLSLCDPDHVELSNLQRQILYKESNCGELKVNCAKRELLALNPHLQISSYAVEASAELLNNNFEENIQSFLVDKMKPPMMQFTHCGIDHICVSKE